MNEKRKILYLITKSNFGGAQRYVFDLATNLPKDTFEAVVAHGGKETLHKQLNVAHIRTIPLRNLERTMNPVRDVLSLFELLKVFRNEKPDVLHLNSTKAGGLGALAGRLAGVPRIIFTSHGLVFDEDRPLPARFMLWVLTWFTFSLCHRVILISSDTHARARRMPFLSEKMQHIYNGRKPDTLLSPLEARENLRQRVGNIPKEPTLLVGTISELTKNKGLKYVLQALARLKDYRWFFVVIGEEGQERVRLAQLAKELGISDRVSLAGRVSDAAKLLPAFDIFTLTSVKEGLPYVLLEAGHAGLPVVASDIAGIQDIITHKDSGILVRPRDINDISSALHMFMENKSERNAYGMRLKKRVLENFSVQKMCTETFTHYY